MGQANEEERTRWRGLLSEQQASGQSIAGFCRERALPVWQFYEWRKRLRTKTEPFVAVEVVASEPAPLPILPIPVPSAPIEISLRGGPDFEARHLWRLLRVLEPEP